MGNILELVRAFPNTYGKFAKVAKVWKTGIAKKGCISFIKPILPSSEDVLYINELTP